MMGGAGGYGMQQHQHQQQQQQQAFMGYPGAYAAVPGYGGGGGGRQQQAAVAAAAASNPYAAMAAAPAPYGQSYSAFGGGGFQQGGMLMGGRGGGGGGGGGGSGGSGSAAGARAEGPPGANVFVHGLPMGTSDHDLLQMMENYGTVLSSRVALDKMTGVTKNFGFIAYADPHSAAAAVAALNGLMLPNSTGVNKKLKVELRSAEAMSGGSRGPRGPAAF
jgi:hypothetical protein